MSTAPHSNPAIDSAVVWHDAECGSYAGDLAIWAEIAAEHSGPILDLGAGTGRVTLHLAERGHQMVAVDSDSELLTALAERAAGRALTVATAHEDARSFCRPDAFELIIAPMQFVHLLDAAVGRREMLAAAATSLRPGGELCAALLEEPLPALGPPGPDEPLPLPDIREVDGWIHSSLPTEIRISETWLSIERLRQLVSPAGELTEAYESVHLDRVGIDAFEAEARSCGFEPCGRVEVPETDRHVGSLISRLRRLG